MKQLIRMWVDWKARRLCRRSGHAWNDERRPRLVRLTDDPWLDFIDGFPAGKPVKCWMCGIQGVETKSGAVVTERAWR